MKNISALTPVDRTAALVTSKGFKYESHKKIKTADSELPILINNTKECEIVGLRRGYLTVLGYSLKVNKRLVCKCDCGVYTLRTAKAMKNINNSQERCEECRHLAFSKRNNYRLRTGKDSDIKDY